MKTRQEVEDLKREWLKDPCWDIECTEGFEDYYDELKAYGLETLAILESERVEKLNSKLGPGWDKFEWVVIDESASGETTAAKVPGGVIVRHISAGYEATTVDAETMVFIPKQDMTGIKMLAEELEEICHSIDNIVAKISNTGKYK